MKEDKPPGKNPTGKENEPVLENTTKKKTKEEKPPTKVVVRRLPPSMTEEQFKVQVSPMPDHDYFYFVPADLSLMPNAFSRAYINFIDQNDLFIFTQKFDGYVFVDSKGGEFPAVVEFAPFQRIPKNRPNRKKDSKVGTIEADPIFLAFKERMEAENLENKTAVNASKQHFFETSLASDKKEEVSNTPLLDYIRNKRAERQRIREEKREEKRKKDLERRRAKEEQRRGKKEDDTSVVKNLPSSPVHPDPQSKEALVDHSEKKEQPPAGKVEKENKTSEELLLKPGPDTVKINKEEQISKKVREIVNFFSKSASEIDKIECKESADAVRPMPNFLKHEDVEREIVNGSNDKKELKSPQIVTSGFPSPKKFLKCNITMGSCNLKEPAMTGSSYPIPVIESRGRLERYVAHRGRSNSDIIMRPVRVNPRDRKEGEPEVRNFVRECEIIRPIRPISVSIPVIHGNRRGCITYNQTDVRKPFAVRTPVRVNIPIDKDLGNEARESSDKRHKENSGFNVNRTVEQEHKISILKSPQRENAASNEKTKKCSTEHQDHTVNRSQVSTVVLKKNLQKVVENVLGNTKVSNPKENFINKPKTFVRRGCSGSGDECQGQGFNTPNFYLPPRAFGFGLGEMSDFRDNKNTGFTSTASTKLSKQFTSSSRKTDFHVSIPKKSLPPFSKKSASSSKSDGDIEEIGAGTRTGGSAENFKRVLPNAFIVQRPYGSLKKSLTVEKSS